MMSFRVENIDSKSLVFSWYQVETASFSSLFVSSSDPKIEEISYFLLFIKTC
jgi:hypothetical protein